MNDTTTTRMMLMTAALAAVAALFAGPANAMLQDVAGGSTGGTASATPVQPGTIPYLSHGIGVDESQFAGTSSPRLTGVHAALMRDRETASASTVQPTVIPYLSHGIGVDESQFGGNGRASASTGGGLDPAIRTAIATHANDTAVGSSTSATLPHGIGVDKTWYAGQPSFGLSGDSALTRVAAPEPEGLTGDSALTRVDRPVGGTVGAGGSVNETDWTWVGFGAGMAALLAAALMGLYLSARNRDRVALP
jgi:hypothetical protein